MSMSCMRGETGLDIDNAQQRCVMCQRCRLHYTFLNVMKMINTWVVISFFAGMLAGSLSPVVVYSAETETTPKTQQAKAMSLLPAIVMETKENPDAAIIWLHGLGADGNDFAPIVPELSLPNNLAIRFIFPHAPSLPVTINGGFVMPAWYDILDMQIDRRVDIQQLMMSAKAIEAFVENELNQGIKSERILLAGFSQGGAVAYQVALSYPQSLGGLLAMSTYFATADSIELNSANSGINIEIHHGLYDPVVPENLGEKAYNVLKEKGYQTHYQTYPMEHSICAEQIGDISRWIQERLR